MLATRRGTIGAVALGDGNVSGAYSGMRLRPIGGFDLATGALILGGACIVALSIVVAGVLLAPPSTSSGTPAQTPVELPTATPALTERPSVAVPADRVATVLTVDVAAGAGSAAQAGDHVDVLGYFPRQANGDEAVTRLLLNDVQVLGVDRSGANVALTLAVPAQSAVLLQEAQAIGAHPFVTLRGSNQAANSPASFSDSDLADRFSLAGAH